MAPIAFPPGRYLPSSPRFAAASSRSFSDARGSFPSWGRRRSSAVAAAVL